MLGKTGDNIKLTINDGNDSNIESVFSLVPDHIEFLPRRSIRNYIKRVLYPSQIVYSSGPLPKIDTKALEVSQSSCSITFVSSHMAKPHEHMI